MPGRNANPTTYRQGFNGMEKDDELKGNGNSYDFGARIYDPRIGRFKSIDPDCKKYPSWSPYLFAANNPIRFIDVDGLGPGDVVVIFAGGDLLSNYGLGSAKALESFVSKNHTNEQGGQVKAFASMYWGVGVKDVKSKDIATQAAYDFIKAHNNENPDKESEGGKIVIYGYSWGGVLAQHLTDRLKADGLEVELLITVDAAAGPASNDVDRTVSDNVKENLNMYQTNPSTIESKGGANTADNPEKTEVTNSNYTNTYSGTPGTGDFQKAEHGSMDEMTQKRAGQKIIETLEKNKKLETIR